MTEVLPGVLQLAAGNPGPLTGAGNATYLWLGRTPTLVDAGIGEVGHVEAIAAALIPGGLPLVQVVVTHAHGDHASGAAALRARWPSAQFFKWPWPALDVRYPVQWRALTDGQTIPAGDDALQVIHTPGHAPDHIVFWHAASRTLFGGDLLIAGSSVVIPGTRGGDLAAYLQSLQRVAALGPSRVLPAHGPGIDAPAALIERYSAHRAQREREVVTALASGAASIDELTDRVYRGVGPALRPAALESIHAHVNKLRDAGRVVERDGLLHLIS
jgi:glyoxylase-like metal-dependent hydrolase (beta-lactamase superfamily II)